MDVSERFKLLVALIGLVALGGLLIIILLLVLWRRFNERQSTLDKRDRSQTDYNDAWSEAGQRLQQEDDEQDEEHIDDDEDDENDDNDDREDWQPRDSDDDGRR